jgi:hypothetical protein
VYGVPLVNMKRVYRTRTSVDVCDAASNGGINQFCPQRQLIDPANHTVVAPNYDTLYAIAWLDLTEQPARTRVVLPTWRAPWTTTIRVSSSASMTRGFGVAGDGGHADILDWSRRFSAYVSPNFQGRVADFPAGSCLGRAAGSSVSGSA